MTWPKGTVTCHYCGSTYLGLNKIELVNASGQTVPFNVYFFPFNLGNYQHRSAGYTTKRFTIYCSRCQQFFTVDEDWAIEGAAVKSNAGGTSEHTMCRNPQGCSSNAIQQIGRERFSINIKTNKIYPQWTERIGGGIFWAILLISLLLAVLFQSYLVGIGTFLSLLVLAIVLSIVIITRLGARTLVRLKYRCSLCGYTWHHFLVYNLWGGLKPENVVKEWWDKAS